MSDLKHVDRTSKPAEASLSQSDVAAILGKANGHTVIGGISDHSKGEPTALSKSQMQALGLPDLTIDESSAKKNATQDGAGTDAVHAKAHGEHITAIAKSDDGVAKDLMDKAQNQHDTPKDFMTKAGDPVFTPNLKGWEHIGPGKWEKDTPLPKDWASETPEEQQKFLKGQESNPFALVQPGGGVEVGYHLDPRTGEYIFVGYAGDRPKGPPPPALKGNGYQTPL